MDVGSSTPVGATGCEQFLFPRRTEGGLVQVYLVLSEHWDLSREKRNLSSLMALGCWVCRALREGWAGQRAFKEPPS